jgi:hypothetical protein
MSDVWIRLGTVLLPESPSGIIVLQSKGNSDLIGISSDRNMVRSHLRASEFIPFLSALNFFADPIAKDWTAIRILTGMNADARRCARAIEPFRVRPDALMSGDLFPDRLRGKSWGELSGQPQLERFEHFVGLPMAHDLAADHQLLALPLFRLFSVGEQVGQDKEAD